MIAIFYIVCAIGGIILGWYFQRLLLLAESTFQRLRDHFEPEETPYVTHTHPKFTNPNKVSQDDSVIVTPKSPQLVQWEEEEELRKLNLRPR